MARYRVKETADIMVRLGKVFDCMEANDIKFSMNRDGSMHLIDFGSEPHKGYDILEVDGGGPVGDFPPTFEYKLTFEK